MSDARLLAVQPRLTVADLHEAVLATDDPLPLAVMANLVRVWAAGRPDVPVGFADSLRVTSLSRQPLVYVAVDVERMDRVVRPALTPYVPGGQIDATPWPTTDPYAVVPLPPPSFPAERLQRRDAVPGRQRVQACDECRGAGAATCKRCEGGGMIVCPRCRAGRRVPCSHCHGSGTVIGISGRYVSCPACDARGSVRCDLCHGQAQVPCGPCDGTGRVRCVVCEGQGNVLAGWAVESAVDTVHDREPFVGEPWPMPLDELFEQTDVVVERWWRPDDPTGGGRPEELGPPAVQAAVAAVLARQSARAASGPRPVAVRVQVRAALAYDVRLSCGGRPASVLVVGTGSRVIPRAMPAADDTGLRAVGRLFRRGVRSLADDATAGVSAAFVRGVRAGRVHLADADGLLPAVADVLRSGARVTADGYSLPVREASATAEQPPVVVAVRLDVDASGELVVSATVDLGPVRRDQFPHLLAANADLMVGRLAVVAGPEGTESVVLTDCRTYRFATAGGYAAVLQAMAAVARRMRPATFAYAGYEPDADL